MNAQTKKKISQAWDIFTTILVIIILLSAMFLMGARVAGLSVYTIISGSMEPTYSVGDLIYVKSVPPEQIEVGDPVTFVLNENLVVATHRVVRVDRENQRLYTKGDNNQIADINPVHYKNVIGKPLFSLPYLGYISAWVKTPSGTYTAIAVGAALLGIVFIPDMFKKANTEEKKKEEKSEEAKEQ